MKERDRVESMLMANEFALVLPRASRCRVSGNNATGPDGSLGTEEERSHGDCLHSTRRPKAWHRKA